MLGIDDTQGVYVAGIEADSGAEAAGLKPGDIIKNVDGVSIYKFSDLTGYLNAKRPDDMVSVTLNRNGEELNKKVVLRKIESYTISELGLRVKNLTTEQLNQRNLEFGVLVTKIDNQELDNLSLEGAVITQINDQNVEDIDQARSIVESQSMRALKLTFYDKRGEKNAIVFR